MMIVATWNMRRKRANWHELPSGGADVMLLQEACSPPRGVAGHWVFEELNPRRGSSTWGTAIWSRWPTRALPGSTSHPGAAAVAEVQTPHGVLTAVSLYALFEYLTLSTRRVGYAVTTLHRLLSDLTCHLEEPTRRSRMVVGGDFNCNPKWDLKSGRPTNRLLLDRVEAYGLKSVLAIDPRVQLATFGKSQIDYLFVAEPYEVRSASVIRAGPLRGLSDHHPVVAELAIRAAGEGGEELPLSA